MLTAKEPSKTRTYNVRRTYRLNKTSTNLYNFTYARRTHNRLLHTIRSNYYKNCIENCNHDLKSMFGLCNKFLGRNIIRVLPDFPSVESFSNFFNTKIKNIISSLPYHSTSYSQIDIDDSLLFNSFNLPSIDNLIRLINSTKTIYCYYLFCT